MIAFGESDGSDNTRAILAVFVAEPCLRNIDSLLQQASQQGGKVADAHTLCPFHCALSFASEENRFQSAHLTGQRVIVTICACLCTTQDGYWTKVRQDAICQSLGLIGAFVRLLRQNGGSRRVVQRIWVRTVKKDPAISM